MKVELSWEFIFKLDNFLKYFTHNELIKLSSLNKTLRNKLKYKIFNKIRIRGGDLETDPDYFGIREDNSANQSIGYKFMNIFSLSSNEAEKFSSLKLNPWINKFMKELLVNMSLVKSIELSDINKPGYYIFPVLNIFLNLRSLKLTIISIGLEDFLNFLNFTELLEVLEVSNIKLVSSSDNEELDNKSTKLPIKLKEISYSQVKIAHSNSLSNPPAFLFEDQLLDLQSYNLPIQSLPNLVKLWYLNSGIACSYINEYLCFNPQLTNLKIESIDLISENLDIISSFNTLKTLIIMGTENDFEILNLKKIPELKSINKLILLNIYSNSYKQYQSLISKCTQLKILELNIISDEEGFYPEFTENMCFLKELKIKLNDE
jgi:hypothetical protein